MGNQRIMLKVPLLCNIRSPFWETVLEKFENGYDKGLPNGYCINKNGKEGQGNAREKGTARGQVVFQEVRKTIIFLITAIDRTKEKLRGIPLFFILFSRRGEGKGGSKFDLWQCGGKRWSVGHRFCVEISGVPLKTSS